MSAAHDNAARGPAQPPRTILITGAAGGIGAALARLYARPGRVLALADCAADRLASLRADVHRAGAICETAVLDVRDGAALAGWIAGIDRTHAVDLVITCAGVAPLAKGPVDFATQTRTTLAINVDGTVETVLAALPGMLARGRGQIGLLSSLGAFAPSPGFAAYGASKAMIRIWGEALRAQLAPRGIRVNVICPGFVDTGMTDPLPRPHPGHMTPARAAAIIARGLAANRARIVFPWWLYLITRTMGMLPPDIVARLSMRTKPVRAAVDETPYPQAGDNEPSQRRR